MSIDFSALHIFDSADPLRDKRSLFHIPEGVTYLDGNSLGCMPLSARQRGVQAITEEWGDGLIRSWLGAGWLTLSQRVGDRIGRLVGAASGQIIAGDSTSINLYKVLQAALDLRPEQSVILTDQDNFPTDLYIIESVARQRGKTVRRASPEEIYNMIDEDVAVVALTHVDYKRASIYDMAEITAKTHSHNALTIWDLAHTAGAVPCELDRCQADFAIGCGYKYLNGGPGAPAFLYVAQRHQSEARQPLQGWFGHRAPFDFDASYEPASDVSRFLCGTPSVIALSILDGALDVYDDIEITAVREKSERMISEFLSLFDSHLKPQGFELVSETAPYRRGSHIAFSHTNSYQIMRALADRGVIGDFRAPDVLRFGFAPLYNRYSEIGALVAALVEVMKSEAWKKPEYAIKQAMT